MTNPVWVDVLLLLIFFLVLLAGFLYGRWCASRFFKSAMKFEPKELRGLSSRTKAVLLKHKSKILKPLGGKE